MINAVNTVYSPRGIARGYYAILTRQLRPVIRSFTENMRAWQIHINNYTQAQYYYDKFFKSDEQQQNFLYSVYEAKLEDLRRIESELGNDAGVADVLPGDNFTRTYIYNCERRLLSPKTYTFSFDCTYTDSTAPKQPKHLAGGVTAIISPAPLVLNILAVISAALGAVLKIALDSQAKVIEKSTTAAGVSAEAAKQIFSQLTTDLITVKTCEAIIAAMITALFFYNVYDSTDVGRKLDLGASWRSALIIGGLSGLLNERIIAALHGLLG
jgi:hypothetical protein